MTEPKNPEAKTETQSSSVAGAAAGSVFGEEVYSRDYTDNVLSQIQRRKLSMFALYLLLALYALAIYAPLLANDRPLYFHGVDLATYKQAQSEMTLVTSSLIDRIQKGSEGYRAGLPKGAKPEEWEKVVGREARAAEVRLRTMSKQLSAEDRAPLQELREAVRAAADKGRRDITLTPSEADEMKRLASQIQSQMSPVVKASEKRPGTVVLQPYQSFPVFANLARGEIFFMVLMAMTLLFPIWNRIVNARLGGDKFRIRRARRPKAIAFLAIPILAAVLWQSSPAAFFASGFKEGLTNGQVLAKQVVFPVIPFGLAESSSERFRPPTWHPNSVIQDGYYVNGPRAGRIDPDTRMPRVANPVVVEFGEPEANTAFRHFLGTDSLGRDILARILWGGRVSLAVGLVGTSILVLIGIVMGALAGFYGGWVDTVISRIIEIVQTFPAFFLILIIVAFVGPSILNIMVIIGLVGWTGVARLVRGEFIRLRGQEFVIASEALGVSASRTIFRHVLPNALGPVLVAATFGVASGILTESALSFLGLGIQLPIPSWGSLLIESRLAEHWWIQIFPGFLIFLTVMLYNLFGEGVRDALDPRMKVTH